MSSRVFHLSSLLLASVAALACACSDDATTDAQGAELASSTGPLGQAFEAASKETGVARDLLVAMAVVEEGLTLPAVREIDEDNEVPAAGPLQLRRGKLDTLARGAASVGRSELDLRRDRDLALRAGARVLAELGVERGLAPKADLAEWADAIGTMSGFADDAHREKYVHDVYRVLARGGSFTGRDGERLVVRPHAVPPALTLDVSSKITMLTTGNAEYPTAEWFPTSCTNKCNTTREGTVGYLLIHDTEGSWNASVATLQNDSGKSAHYIVGQDGRVGQFVTESVNAWHAGNGFYNNRSVGIEHVGWHDQPFPTALYDASAKLADYLATKYAIPRDRAHVIGHDQVPNGNRIASSSAACALSPKGCQASLDYGGASNHGDPGIWEWATYMPRFGGQAKCNDATAILNCSKDKSQAFRCVNGQVEVLACASCTVMPSGQDDACTPPTPAPAPATPDTTTDDGEEPPSEPVTPPPSMTVGEAPLEADDTTLPPAGGGESGCQASRGTSIPPGTSGMLAVVAALALVSRARGRRRTDA